MTPNMAPDDAAKVQQATAAVQQLMQQKGIQPIQLVRLGHMAYACLRNPDIYPQFRAKLIESGIATEAEIPPNMLHALLAAFITMGKIAQGMVAR